MDINEFNSGAGFPETKPWLTPVVYSLEAQNVQVKGRVTQEGGLTTPYGLWACKGTFITSSTGGVIAMGIVSGDPAIPAASLYDGHTTRIKVAGSWTTAGADTATISIRNAGNSITYASVTLVTGGPVVAEIWSAEFELQIQRIGGAAVGRLAIVASADREAGGTGVTSLTQSVNSTTFSSTSGVDYNVYIGVGVGTSNVIRNLAYATVVF